MEQKIVLNLLKTPTFVRFIKISSQTILPWSAAGPSSHVVTTEDLVIYPVRKYNRIYLLLGLTCRLLCACLVCGQAGAENIKNHIRNWF